MTCTEDVDAGVLDLQVLQLRRESREVLSVLLADQEMENRKPDLLTEDQMAAIKSETLIVWGAQNPFGDIPEARRMHASIPGSRLEIFGECGHWPQHEHADRFNALTKEFLSA